jgi:thiol:disulfide interchange protein/DsbC/DsbD-like thiol-disulfide interchange protein
MRPMTPTFSNRLLRSIFWRLTLLSIAFFAISSGVNGQLLSSSSLSEKPSVVADREVAAVVTTPQVRAELLVHAPDGISPGKTMWLGLRLQHQPHWHTYWKNPGDSGLPTQLQWTLPTGLHAGEIDWPLPRKIAIGTLANLGYEGDVLLPVPVTVSDAFRPSGLETTTDIKLSASWLVCREECIPQEGQFQIRLALRGSSALHAGLFSAALAAAPKTFGGKLLVEATASGLLLQASGLPAHWTGKALRALPETTALLDTPALPDTSDTLQTLKDSPEATLQPGQQGWSGTTWKAHIPYAAQRSASPATLAWVLSAGDAAGPPSVRADAPVAGTWPSVAPSTGVSPALEAALEKNQRSASENGIRTFADGWLLMALGALLGGLILNLMPCVFPVLAIKILAFASHDASPLARRTQGLAYTAGVVISFMALGGLLLTLRAGGEQLGWGFQLQSPAVIAGLALLFTALALNLAGWLRVGHWVPSGLAGLQLKHPAAEAFLSGMLAVVIASPCTAPFMGASLGYALTLPGLEALVLFAALGFGLALPYVLASFVPAVGRWLPRPGAWMKTLQQFLAFPMAATVVWLVWVMGHLSGVDGAAGLLLLILSLCLLVWSLGLTGHTRLFFASVSVAACALLAALLSTTQFSVAQPSVAARGQAWTPWSPAAVETALQQGRPVFVDFTAAWCITCQVNKKTTLSDDSVKAAFTARNVTLLRADWTRRDPAITQALQELGRSGVPVYVLYAPGRAPQLLSEILSPREVLDALARGS